MKQDKKEKRNNILYSVLGLVLGIAMCGIGIYGMILNRIESQEYKNATDKREVIAVVESCREIDNSDDKDKNKKEKVERNNDGQNDEPCKRFGRGTARKRGSAGVPCRARRLRRRPRHQRNGAGVVQRARYGDVHGQNRTAKRRRIRH